MDSGYLDLILGPMFSGKTSKLIDIYYIHRLSSRLLVINHASDTRYTTDAKMMNHDNVSIPCVLVSKLSDLQVNMDHFDRILINEGQLFPDLYEFVMEQIYKNNKYVYIAALDGDYKRNPFGQVHQLISHADSILKFQGTCAMCKKKPSIFTLRITEDKEQILIGSDQYKPVCRKCYEKHNIHF